MKVDSRIRQRNFGYSFRICSSGSRITCAAGRNNLLSRFMHPHQYVDTILESEYEVNHSESRNHGPVEGPILCAAHAHLAGCVETQKASLPYAGGRLCRN